VEQIHRALEPLEVAPARAADLAVLVEMPLSAALPLDAVIRTLELQSAGSGAIEALPAPEGEP
jgi:hypothetical protein